MLKMEIALDRELLEAQGYDWDTSYDILCKNFERAGFVKESFENGHLVYRGTGSDKDMSYFALIMSALVDVNWFKKCVKTWFLIVPEHNTFDYQDYEQKSNFTKITEEPSSEKNQNSGFGKTEFSRNSKSALASLKSIAQEISPGITTVSPSFTIYRQYSSSLVV